jgi:arginine deiminase
VANAKRDHFDFVQKKRDRGIEVVEMHNLLAETVAIPEGRAWILDHRFGSVGAVLFILAIGSFSSVSFATRSLEVAVGRLATRLRDKGCHDRHDHRRSPRGSDGLDRQPVRDGSRRR